MRETILVTGAEGFIGRHLVPALAQHGHHVERHTRKDSDIVHAALSYGDVTHVFHLAARTFVPESWTNPFAFYETNVLGTINVLEFCRRQQASLTLVSSYVYGTPQQLPVPEQHPSRAFNPYAHSKILAEEAGRYYAEQFGIQVTIVRPFNVYGPGQGERFLIPSLIHQALSPHCDSISIQDPRPKRDYLYVTDFIGLLLTLLEHRSSDTYNAGSGRSVSIQELVDLINSFLPLRKSISSTGVARREEVLDVAADIRKAWEQLRWKPTTPIEAGLRQMIAAMSAAPQDWLTQRGSPAIT
jgi:nucleoside-diphosphate-sugar epimerase